MLKRLALCMLAATCCWTVAAAAVTTAVTTEPPRLLTAADLAQFDNPPADARIPYGDGPLQFGDLRLPPGPGPHPVAVFIHGGCWLAEYDITHSSKLTAALARHGIATWSLEYRRVGDDGGGWPGTFQDIGRGADHLRSIAGEYHLDLARVIAMGHSAGGHLALWLAARSHLPADSPIAAADPLPVRGVLALAPAADLEVLHEKKVCGDVIDKLMGGSPEQVPDRYRWGGPMHLAPAGVPQIVIIGAHDEAWGPSGLRYFRTAAERGDQIRKIDAPGSGHFEMIDPDSTTWPLVLGAARQLLGLGDE
ncbi:MAG: alpha/beta hydrolase [Acidobacteriota bacterium]